MTSIGNLLKQARQKKAVSFEEIQAKLKIHPRVLQILEEDKFEKLPGPLFAKSFLKSYADFLELNSAELVQIYENEWAKAPEQVLFLKPADPYTRAPIGSSKPRSLGWWVAGFLGCGALLFGVLGLFPRAPKPTPVASSTAARAGVFVRSVSQGNFPAIHTKTPLLLTIRALDNVWLRVTVDGKVLFQSILKRGSSESWTATDRIEIWTGNSANMQLSLNRYRLGSPGKGVVKRMIVNREGVRVAS